MFTYASVPTVTGISPASGPSTGGHGLTITGTGFTSVTGIVFGATPATVYSVLNATTIGVLAPASSTMQYPGDQRGGHSAINQPADQYTYT